MAHCVGCQSVHLERSVMVQYVLRYKLISLVLHADARWQNPVSAQN